MIGKRLKELRKQYGLSQRALVKATGVPSIAAYEAVRRSNPCAAHLLKLSNFFDVSIRYLLGAEEIKPVTTTKVPLTLEERVESLEGHTHTEGAYRPGRVVPLPGPDKPTPEEVLREFGALVRITRGMYGLVKPHVQEALDRAMYLHNRACAEEDKI